MNGQSHSVKKFVLELQLPSGAEAYPLQRRCSEMIRQQLVTGLDSLLTECFDENEFTRIPYLEIDLGDIAPSDIEHVFADRCLQQLSEKLKTIGRQRKASADIPVERIPMAQHVIDRFIHFLVTGQLPAPAGPPAMNEWSEEIMKAVVADNVYFTERLSGALAADTQIAERLILQFDLAFIERLMSSCEPPLKKEMVRAMLRSAAVMGKLAGQDGGRLIKILLEPSEPLVKEAVIELVVLLQPVAVQYPSLPVREKILRVLVTRLYGASAGRIAAVTGAIKEWLARKVAGSPGSQGLPAMMEELELLTAQWEQGLASAPPASMPGDGGDTEISDRSGQVAGNRETVKEAPEETAVFIGNAGLIILHPFLNSLFEKTGLTRNNSFINDEARHRAVHLLQYMATGQEQAPEYLMQLNKILCGVPRELHIDRFILLTPEQKDEAESLLQAVIGHWAVLKNSSVTALQETFLQRRGKLDFSEEDHTWKLQVERKAFDILLDRLPWGYSQVRLSWMEHRLMTEW
ncbi:MAG: contractile injection system tape measure protein [Chitinophagaceae bacterium]